MSSLRISTLFIFSFISIVVSAQPPQGIHWSKDGNSYYQSKDNQIVQTDLASSKSTVIVTKEQLTPAVLRRLYLFVIISFQMMEIKFLFIPTQNVCGATIHEAITG